MFYIIGLGNPGEKYASTRHNVGRLVLEWIAEHEGFGSWDSDKHANARTVRGSVAGNPVEFFEPETYMNKSGDTVKYLKDKQGAKPEDVVVVYDDVELPLGEIKGRVQEVIMASRRLSIHLEARILFVFALVFHRSPFGQGRRSALQETR